MLTLFHLLLMHTHNKCTEQLHLNIHIPRLRVRQSRILLSNFPFHLVLGKTFMGKCMENRDRTVFQPGEDKEQAEQNQTVHNRND